MAVSTNVSDGIAVVTINNPPVNATSHKVRQGLWDALKQTSRDDRVRAVVLHCAGRTFIAGADIREFDQPPREPSLPDLLHKIETASKPWIAAIHGTALGGGLETALACHYRVAATKAKLGLPEVALGLVPGAGGTVRLPRLIAPDRALEIIAGGKPISAQMAADLGLADQLAESDLLDDAIAFAQDAASLPLPVPVSQRPVLAASTPDAFDAAAVKIRSKARGQLAPNAAIEAVLRAMEHGAEDAFATERAAFLELRDGAQSRALRHVFFAERATARIDRIQGTSARRIQHVGVIGGGTMGAGIAAAALLSEFRVTMIEQNADAANAGHARVTRILDQGRTRGIVSQQLYSSALDCLTALPDYSRLSDADLVIEAVFEDMDTKVDVLQKSDAVVGPEAILATNTSYLDVNALAARTLIPSRVIGLHFFSPAHIMKLLEIVVPDGLDEQTLATCIAFAKRLRKVPVLSRVCEGFIANRIMSAYRQECEYMLEDGALPWEIDEAMMSFGMPMGIFQMQDLAGLDISWAMRKRQAAIRDPGQRYVHIADKLCEMGRFGQKTGRGWYIYQDNVRMRDPEVEALILAESERKGITRRSMDHDQVIARILARMQEEGRAVLNEGIAQRAEDIDVVMVNAFGFPRWRGGPLYMASRS